MLHHKENLGYNLKSGSNKKLEAPSSGKLYFLAYKPGLIFVAEEKLKVIKKTSSVSKSAFNVLCTEIQSKVSPSRSCRMNNKWAHEYKIPDLPSTQCHPARVCACGKQAPTINVKILSWHHQCSQYPPKLSSTQFCRLAFTSLSSAYGCFLL